MYKNSFKILFSFAVSALLVAGCASKPSRPEPIAQNSDPNAEIELTESKINNSRTELEVYAPETFAKAEQELKKAKQARADDKDTSTVIKHLSYSRGWLKEAEEKGAVAKMALVRVREARDYAIKARANETEKKDFAKLEAELKDLTREVEEGSTKEANNESDELVREYNRLEVKAAVQTNLGQAQVNFTNAQDEGAKEYAPKSFNKAKNSINEAKNLVMQNVRTPAAYQDKVAEANSDAATVLIVTREGKKANQGNAEDVVLQSLDLKTRVQELNQEQRDAEAQAAQEQNRLMSVNAKTQEKLNRAKGYQVSAQRIQAIQSKFNPNEAEVFAQGEKVLIRVKGLNFASNGTDIPVKSFPILQKVKESIAEFNDPKVIVEGHTDSVGTAERNKVLSEKRASVVQDYLVANQAVSKDQVQSVGYGFEKPIAPNKTKSQRAMNRRIDVVIEPSSVQ